MAKVCVFCGGTPLTKEDVLPRWLKVALDPWHAPVRPRRDVLPLCDIP
ncbi:hypothetical protein ACFO9E_27360 [Streptomyces maoxianensis]|uniref:Uncharacterized protein n=1 Tax=Streptomyces maoxianensis TaxID=1459942 RepID=A0ABV9GEL7_9ACTN